MRRAARIASRARGRRGAALYVTRHDGLSGVSPERLASLRAKTEALGGTFHALVDDDPAEAILEFARAENASQVIIGMSRRSRFSTLLRPGIGERVTVIPNHACVVTNLHYVVYAVRGERVERVLPVAARGRVR